MTWPRRLPHRTRSATDSATPRTPARTRCPRTSLLTRRTRPRTRECSGTRRAGGPVVWRRRGGWPFRLRRGRFGPPSVAPKWYKFVHLSPTGISDNALITLRNTHQVDIPVIWRQCTATEAVSHPSRVDISPQTCYNQYYKYDSPANQPTKCYGCWDLNQQQGHYGVVTVTLRTLRSLLTVVITPEGRYGRQEGGHCRTEGRKA